jgi:hypothetical protein
MFFRLDLYMTLSCSTASSLWWKFTSLLKKFFVWVSPFFYTTSLLLVGLTENYRVTVSFDDITRRKRTFCLSLLSFEFLFLYASIFIHGSAQLVTFIGKPYSAPKRTSFWLFLIHRYCYAPKHRVMSRYIAKSMYNEKPEGPTLWNVGIIWKPKLNLYVPVICCISQCKFIGCLPSFSLPKLMFHVMLTLSFPTNGVPSHHIHYLLLTIFLFFANSMPLICVWNRNISNLKNRLVTLLVFKFCTSELFQSCLCQLMYG